jgi:hypothetical protein
MAIAVIIGERNKDSGKSRNVARAARPIEKHALDQDLVRLISWTKAK